MSYTKINKEMVLDHLKANIHCDGIDIYHSARSVARGLKTSKYQARKQLKLLESEGFIKYTSRTFCMPDYESGECYCENHLPEWGYAPTLKLRKHEQHCN